MFLPDSSAQYMFNQSVQHNMFAGRTLLTQKTSKNSSVFLINYKFKLYSFMYSEASCICQL